MVAPITSPVVNKVGRDQFKPLASAKRQPLKRANYVEWFAAKAAPSVLSRQEPVIGDVAPFDPLAPSGMIEILQISLPSPMPIGLTLGCYEPTGDRFAEAVRFSAEFVNDVNLPSRGRFIIEWGLGKARNYCFTDLGPGVLQIPVSESLKVFAHVYGDNPGGLGPGDTFCIAGASAYPGEVVDTQDATFTAINNVSAGLPIQSQIWRVPPFARAFSAGTFGDANTPGQRADIYMNDGSGFLLATWQLQPAFQFPSVAATPTTSVQPYQLANVILPGGATTLSTTVYGVSANGGIYVTELIRL